MLPTPKKVTVVAGGSEGDTRLTAFDKALMKAGIGNLNLIRVSSILPPAVDYVESLVIPSGSLTPTAYGSITSDTPGEVISASIGIGFSESDYGLIMEFSGICSKEEAERIVTAMVEEGFAARGMVAKEIKVAAVEHKVEKVGAVVAAAALWY